MRINQPYVQRPRKDCLQQREWQVQRPWGREGLGTFAALSEGAGAKPPWAGGGCGMWGRRGGRGRILQSLKGGDEEFGFDSQCSGEPLRNLKQRSGMIRFGFGEDHSCGWEWKWFFSNSRMLKDVPGTHRVSLDAFIDTRRCRFTEVEIALQVFLTCLVLFWVL